MNDLGMNSTKIGPSTALLIKNIHKNIEPEPRKSELVMKNLSDAPKSFHDQNGLSFTSAELLNNVMTEPNVEFYYGLILPLNRDGSWGGNIDDAWMLEIAQEIWAAYPSYVVKYGSRNLLKMFFDPGWLSPRYATTGWTRQGSQFVAGEHTWNTHSADSPYVKESYGERAARELEFNQIKSLPKIVSAVFFVIGCPKVCPARLFVQRLLYSVGWAHPFGVTIVSWQKILLFSRSRTFPGLACQFCLLVLSTIRKCHRGVGDNPT